jgi:hypothetical protein
MRHLSGAGHKAVEATGLLLMSVTPTKTTMMSTRRQGAGMGRTGTTRQQLTGGTTSRVRS